MTSILTELKRETSVRLKNTAYGFASAIAGAVTGEGGESGGGLLIDYLKKSCGDMTSIFRANIISTNFSIDNHAECRVQSLDLLHVRIFLV